MYRAFAAVYGMMPADVDDLDVEAVFIALAGMRDRARREWAAVTYLAATVINNRGMVEPPKRAVQPKDLMDAIFGAPAVKVLPDFWERWERAAQREQELIEARRLKREQQGGLGSPVGEA